MKTSTHTPKTVRRARASKPQSAASRSAGTVGIKAAPARASTPRPAAKGVKKAPVTKGKAGLQQSATKKASSGPAAAGKATMKKTSLRKPAASASARLAVTAKRLPSAQVKRGSAAIVQTGGSARITGTGLRSMTMIASGVVTSAARPSFLTPAAPREEKLAVTAKRLPSARMKKGRAAIIQTSPGTRMTGTGVHSMAMMASGVVTNAARPSFITPGTPRLGKRSARRITRKPRLLWIGDALVPTGFATVTHAVLAHLHHDWEITVSGVNYDGSKHKLPYQVLPAWQGGDMWGMDRFQHLCAEFDPAAVVINNDWWNVARFVDLAPAGVPVIGYMPVDGGSLDPQAMRTLNKLHAAVWYTDYGHREAVKAGFKGARHVIPHGIDPKIFSPVDRGEARRILDLNVPKNAFIVGNLNRNQPRKRLDLTIQIFADWIKQHNISNAFLLLHCAEKDTGWDLRQIAAFYGVADRLLCTGGEDMRDLQSPHHLQLIYSSLDLQMTTTLGEGWGLTTMEGMACGIPQIVPDSSALAEWATPAVKVPCSRILFNTEINTTGALVDHQPFVAALQELYRDKAARARLSAQGLAHVRRAEFRWSSIGRQFHDLAAAVSPSPSLKQAKQSLRA